MTLKVIEKEKDLIFDLGRKISIFRKSRDMKQDAFAQLLGVNQSTVSRIETGERRISLNDLYAIANIFKVDINTIINWDSDVVFQNFGCEQAGMHNHMVKGNGDAFLHVMQVALDSKDKTINAQNETIKEKDKRIEMLEQMLAKRT